MNIIDLAELRKNIDILDAELLAALAKRMQLIPQVAAYKKANNVQRYQPEREKEVFQKWRTLAEQQGVNPDLAEKIIRTIIEDAHRIEEEIINPST